MRGAITVERDLRGVKGVRADVVNPAQIRVVADTIAGIQEAEELGGVALAPLKALGQRQPVVLAKVLI